MNTLSTKCRYDMPTIYDKILKDFTDELLAIGFKNQWKIKRGMEALQ